MQKIILALLFFSSATLSYSQPLTDKEREHLIGNIQCVRSVHYHATCKNGNWSKKKKFQNGVDEIEVEKTQQSIAYATEKYRNITNEQNELKSKLTQIEVDKTTKFSLIHNLENDTHRLLEQKTSSEEIKRRHEEPYFMFLGSSGNR